jgi:DNA-binding NarL/FixJ family response regulator
MTAGAAMTNGATTRCLIADDQAMVREGFAAVLTAQPGLLVVGQAADGADAVIQTRHLQPDVVLMDVRMPVMDGLQATRQILGPEPGPHRPHVLMLTTFDLDDYVYEALRAGASGFLLKDATAAELVHAVRVIAAGDALLAPSVTRRLIADFARRPRADPPPPAPLGALTHRETEVLQLIARGLSNAEISTTLFIAEQTTKTHIGRILAKLNLRDRAQAVVLAYESGSSPPAHKIRRGHHHPKADPPPGASAGMSPTVSARHRLARPRTPRTDGPGRSRHDCPVG